VRVWEKRSRTGGCLPRFPYCMSHIIGSMSVNTNKGVLSWIVGCCGSMVWGDLARSHLLLSLMLYSRVSGVSTEEMETPGLAKLCWETPRPNTAARDRPPKLKGPTTMGGRSLDPPQKRFPAGVSQHPSVLAAAASGVPARSARQESSSDPSAPPGREVPIPSAAQITPSGDHIVMGSAHCNQDHLCAERPLFLRG